MDKTDHEPSPEEAVDAYYDILQANDIKPCRPMENGLKTTDLAMSCDGNTKRRGTGEIHDYFFNRARSNFVRCELTATDWATHFDVFPDFERMDSDQQLACNLFRLN